MGHWTVGSILIAFSGTDTSVNGTRRGGEMAKVGWIMASIGLMSMVAAMAIQFGVSLAAG